MEVKPGYKQTEVGVIPQEWVVSKLQEACRETITYGIVQCGPHVKNGVPYIRVSDMDGPELDVDRMLRTSPTIAVKFARSTVNEGDIVYALRGKLGEVRQVGQAAAGANLTQGTAKLSPGEQLASSYLLWAMRSPRSLRQAEIQAKGTTFREITLADLRRIQIPIPTPPEQRAIAEALSDVDSLIGALDQLIAKKRDLKQAAMQQLLTGQTRLPGFHGEWSNNPLRSFVRQFIVPMRDKPSSLKGDIPWCRIEDFDGMYLTDSKSGQGVDAQTIRAMNLKVYPVGTLLVSCSADLGRCAVVARPLVSNQTFIGLEMDEAAASNLFFYYLMSSKAEELNNLSSGTTISYLPREKFEEFNVLAPLDKQEQTAIAEVLSDMDAELAALEQRRDKTRALKQGMMQELLTGRTRLV